MTETPTISQKSADNAAAGLAGIKELAMLDDGTLKDLERIEREIFFRQFYFPGGQPVLRLPGLGKDKPGKYKYDQIPGERYLFDDWDPRYIPEYIQQAGQKGFHRHFLYFNGVSVETISYDDAADKLYYAIEGNGFKDSDANVAYGILSGLIYMDKLKTFCDEFKSKLGKTKLDLETMANLGRSYVSIADQQLKKVIGQSKDTFISKDNGWYTRDMKYAFDVSEFAREWEEKQAVYQEYKNKIWEILKNVQNLNLCTNNSSGINVGNVTIKQETECLMKIQNDTNIIEQPTGTEQTPTTDGQQSPTPPAQQEVQQQSPTPPAQQEVQQQSPTPVPEDDSSSNVTIIIVVAVVVVVAIGIGTFFIIRNMRKKNSSLADVNTSIDISESNSSQK